MARKTEVTVEEAATTEVTTVEETTTTEIPTGTQEDTAPSATPSGVVEVFGKFAVEIKGVVTLFDTKEQAVAEEVSSRLSGQFEDLAVAYCKYRELDLDTKMAKGKINVIKDFLAFQASI